jgi:hypothetical protein
MNCLSAVESSLTNIVYFFRRRSFRYKLYRVLEGGYYPWDRIVEYIILVRKAGDISFFHR